MRYSFLVLVVAALSVAQAEAKSVVDSADTHTVYRRASSAETLNVLCQSAGETKVGFCDSMLPVAETDKNNKAPLRRRMNTMELFKQIIPSEGKERRSTSTVHLCSRGASDRGDLLEIRGYPGLCKRLIQSVDDVVKSDVEEATFNVHQGIVGQTTQSSALPNAGVVPLQSRSVNKLKKRQGTDKAITGSELGAEKGLEGSYIGYEASKQQLEYSLAHPNETFQEGVAALESSLKKKKRQIIPTKALSGSEYGAEKGLEGGYIGYNASKEQLEYSIQHPKETFTEVVGLLQSGAKRQLSLLLPCVKDESSSDEAGFCDSLIPGVEERDIVDLIQRNVHFNAHRRFARPQSHSL